MSEQGKFVQAVNTGGLFPNRKKVQPKQPDMTGSATFEDGEYLVSAWKKTSSSGMEYLSLKFTNKDDLQPVGTHAETKPAAPAKPVDEDLKGDKIDW